MKSRPVEANLVILVQEFDCLYIQVAWYHGSRFAIQMMYAHFTHQCLGLPHELADCIFPGLSQLIFVALLLLMGHE